jgi:hypothetical protein
MTAVSFIPGSRTHCGWPTWPSPVSEGAGVVETVAVPICGTDHEIRRVVRDRA